MSEPTAVDRFTWEGIQLIWVILGFIGAALGISSMPPMSKRQLVAALAAGVVCAALIPQVSAELLAWLRSTPTVPLPSGVNNVLAFFFGIGGMFIIPGAIVFWRSFQTNPFFIIDWVRGKGPPPPAPPAGPGEHP